MGQDTIDSLEAEERARELILDSLSPRDREIWLTCEDLLQTKNDAVNGLIDKFKLIREVYFACESIMVKLKEPGREE